MCVHASRRRLRSDQGGGSLLLVVNDTGSLVVLDVAQAADQRPSHAHRAAKLRAWLDAPQRLHAPPPPPLAAPAPAARAVAAAAAGDSHARTVSIDLLGDEVPLDAPPPPPAAAPATAAGSGGSAGLLPGGGSGAAGKAARPPPLTHVVLSPPPPLSSSLLLPRAWLLLLRVLMQLGLPVRTLRALAGLGPAVGGEGSGPGAHGEGEGLGLAEAVDELMGLLPIATHKVECASLARVMTRMPPLLST